MFKALIIFGIVWVICGLGLAVITYVDMREEVKNKQQMIEAYRKLVQAQDEQIIAFKRLTAALQEKIQIMKEGAENG